MKKYIGFAVIAASMFIVPFAMAQQGAWEMSLAGNVENSTNSFNGAPSSNSKSTYVDAKLGRYFTNKLVGRASVFLMGQDSQGSKMTTTAVGVDVKYYFGEPADSKWVPFVNGGLNYVLMDLGGGTSGNGYGIAAGGGVSHFLTEQVSLDLSLRVFKNMLTMDANGAIFDMDSTGKSLLFGVTARF